MSKLTHSNDETMAKIEADNMKERGEYPSPMVVQELIDIAHQYRKDMAYMPTAEQKRRVEWINSVLEKVEP